mgnify:FL=1
MNKNKHKKSLKNKANFLKAISRLPKDQISHVVEHLDDNSIETICECVYNAIYTDISASKRKKKLLQKNLHKHCCLSNLKLITSPNVSVSKKRKALKQEGTGLGLILSTIVPLIAKLFV